MAGRRMNGDFNGHRANKTGQENHAPRNRGQGRYRLPRFQDTATSIVDEGRMNSKFNNRDTENQPPVNRREYNRKKFVGFKKLEEWTKKEPTDIIVEILDRQTGFEDLLDSSHLTGDTVILVTTVLSKLCTSMFSANKTYIMNLASKDKFIESIQKYVFNLQLQDKSERHSNLYFWQDVDSFFNNMLIICSSLLESIPTRACEILPKTIRALCLTIDYLGNSEGISVFHNIKTGFEKLLGKLILFKAELEQKKKEMLNIDNRDEAPPDDFRQLSVYPSVEEILSAQPAFIRRNIIDGAYDNVDHYLDVQFRLLKEDFVAPLRNGVAEFLNSEINQRRHMKFSNVRIHHHVEFICPHFSNEKSGVLLQFEFATHKKKRIQNVNRYRRRFMFGSLLCFTKDNFTTVFFGKVIERDAKLLEKNTFVVEFQPGFIDFAFNKPYCMVECAIYFEPYFHVLSALQNIDDNTFPMRKYLIDVNSNMEPPTYITAETYFVVHGVKIPLLVSEAWPGAESLNLDDTQYQAFKAALTQSFSVIQGPPGTGKTYVGLEIARTLIKRVVTGYCKRTPLPILVVCYTNHALDQFLEGLIETTDKIIRIGGQSKNKKLEALNIRSKRYHTSGNLNNALINVRNQVTNKLTVIKTLTDTINIIEKHDCILDFQQFTLIDPTFSLTWFASAKSVDILDWLLGGGTQEERQQKLREIDVQKLMQDNSNETLSAEVHPNVQLEQSIEDEHRNAIEDLDDLFDTPLISQTKSILTLGDMLSQMNLIRQQLNTLGGEVKDVAVFNRKWELEYQLINLEENYQYFKMRLNRGREQMIYNKSINRPTDLNLKKPHHMLPDDRWQLYIYWVSLLKETAIKQLSNLQKEYRHIYQQYTELRHIEDIQVMKQMVVIGMTTTSAARLQASLQTVKCPIVIVEEAAEVLESHIVVSLTNACQQLILIGDHKQLKPSTATFKLEKDFHLGVSLFERMVRNKIQCHVLGVQHRMRPEFAKLIVPTIYPTLLNHSSVELYPPVTGMLYNLYFITHNNLEEEVGDSSKANAYEAAFIIALARYLIQNGYQPEDITILAAYTGQMFALMNLRSQNELLLKDVRITVLDNYQGEESKIILLSLVRNNKDNKIGFLVNENRVCVALSRAREGFYIMGNIDLLCNSSSVWPKIRKSLEEQQALGTSLPLQCQLHYGTITKVESANDFNKVPEGGCSLVCGELLQCGHNCTRICHINDRVHVNTTCKIKCERIVCDKNHKCQKMCYEDCGDCQVLLKHDLRCGHSHAIQCFINPDKFNCPTEVVSKLPCNHEVPNKPCYMDVTQFRCPFPCDTRVEPCGHSCIRDCHIQNDPDHLQYKCYKECERFNEGCSTGTHKCPKKCHEVCSPCNIAVKKRRTVCSHVFSVECNSNVDEIECHKPCIEKLFCGHKCRNKCFEECGNCTELVMKKLEVCQHQVRTLCSKAPDVKNCNGRCSKLLSCGHECGKLCKDTCTIKCLVLVNHSKAVACGHKFQIPCFMVNQEYSSNSHELLQYCNEPCGAELQCKHVCSGTCGVCIQGRIHKTCDEKCGVPLVCGHECTTPCRGTCQPCTRLCNFKCPHNIVCRKKCGDPCTKCVEKCRRSCAHGSCKATCGELCTVPPCSEPCPKRLKCGHNCVGYCGDPCPLLCRICNHDELTEIFFGFEDEEGARFVVLMECKHIFESEGIEEWLKKSDNAIGYKQCPRCKTILCKTLRYSDYIKTTRQDVINIKKKFFGDFTTNETERVVLLHHLKALTLTANLINVNDIIQILEKLETAIKPNVKGRRQPINRLAIQTFTAKFQILERIVKTYKDAKLKKADTIRNMFHMIKMLLRPLQIPDQRITNQELVDFDRELCRLDRLAQLSQLEEELTIITDPDIINLHNEVKNLIFGIHIFSKNCDVTVREKIIKLHRDIRSKSVLTEQERKQIVQAMGMSSGHWYKCPNGHYYAIGECGGAMQTSKCADCGVPIGGSQHRLLANNQHAGEMDHSARAAWPPH